MIDQVNALEKIIVYAHLWRKLLFMLTRHDYGLNNKRGFEYATRWPQSAS